MSNPVAGGKASRPMAMHLSLPPQQPGTSTQQTATRIKRHPYRGLIKRWPVFLLLMAGMVVYTIYWFPRAGFSTPLSVPFRLSGNFGELRPIIFTWDLIFVPMERKTCRYMPWPQVM
ncbi:hypothetical protein [Paraflavitalea speifideaquila]|uniref:hypothetical protein n=1 Tax=Paraflavitalea speifideaquila TaxID=3076558 RepID=UPI0028EE1B7B|nr:hypothetical protein [Paraflavitalea speifideiaquila]